MKTRIPIFLAVLFSVGTISAFGQKIDQVLINFGSKNFDINDDAKKQIDEVAGRLLPGERVELTFLDEGDLQKDERFQINIAKNRALQAYQYILDQKYHGCKADAMVPGQKKNAQVVMSNADLRNVQQINGIMVVQLYRDIYWKPMYFLDPSANSPEKCQEFRINTTYGGVINGYEGTQILIPADAFFITGCTEAVICLQEYYRPSEMVKAGLTTTSNGKLLISEGMIYLKATDGCTGAEIKLKKEITIAMPTQQGNKATQLFAGKKEDLIINWLERDPEEFAINKAGTVLEPEPLPATNGEEGGGERENITLENSSFVFKTKKLDWINCDRYYELKEPANLIVESKELNQFTTVLVVLKNDRSIIPAYLYAGETSAMVQPLPPNQPVTIIAMRAAGTEYELSYVEATSSDTRVQLPAFRSESETSLQAALSGLLDN
jgi:hypothetical protein